MTLAEEPLRTLTLPERLTIDVSVWQRDGALPYRGAPIVLGVETYAREKGDYQLGPIFTDDRGHVELRRSDLECYAASARSSGLMEYADIEQAYTFVQIVHWSAEQIENAIRARTEAWTDLLEGEGALFGSVSSLVRRYREAGNAAFSPMHWSPVRDEWDGGLAARRYKYTLHSIAA